MYNFSTVIAFIIFLIFWIVFFSFFLKAAYEKMEEAKRAIFELGKEVTRGFIQLAPEEIKSIIRCKRVRQGSKPLEKLISDEDRWKMVVKININRTVIKIWELSFFLTILSKGHRHCI